MRELIQQFSDISDYQNIQQYYCENLSTYYFPGDLTAFYSNIMERHTTQDIVCSISGSVIKKGSLYIAYRPLIENLRTRQAFVLKKTIKCESIYGNFLPQNIMELEDLNQKVCNHEIEAGIEYDNLYHFQNGEIILQKLNKIKRRLTIKSQEIFDRKL